MLVVGLGVPRGFNLNTATKLALAVLALTALFGPSYAQNGPTTVLPGIVVESGTVGLSETEAYKLGSAVSVVTGEQLENRQIRHAADALRTVPGVSVSNGGPSGALTQVRLRGAETNHVLVLIDGIEINRTTDGFFDFSSLLADDIERIEVLRGPQSGIWGSNALSGVINIVTTDGKGPAQVSMQAQGGSFETRSGTFSVRGGSERVHGVLSMTSRETRGINISDFGNEDDGSRQVNVRAKGAIQLTEALGVEGNYHRLNNYTDIDGVSGAAPGAGAGSFSVTLDQQNATNDTETEIFGGAAKLNLFDDHWTSRFYINQNAVALDNINPAFGNSFTRSDREQFGVVSTLRAETPRFLGSSHQVTGMLETEDEGFLPSADMIRRTRNIESGVAEYRGEFMDKLFVNASVRHDDSNTFKDFTTYKVSGAKLILPLGTRFHGSYGTGVVYPSMFEQFGQLPAFFTPNPNLLPEESAGWDAGIEQQLFGGTLVVDVTYFEQNLGSEIVSVPVPGTFAFTSDNLSGKSLREGIEVSATARPLELLEIVSSYTYLNASEPDKREEIRRPTHSGSVNAALHFAQDRGLFHLGMIYNGKMQDIVFDAVTFASSRLTLDDYVLVNMALRYDVDPRVQLFGRVENLLDEDYEDVFAFNTTGIAAYGGVRVKFSTDDAVEGDQY